jgi:hypothetical protein
MEEPVLVKLRPGGARAALVARLGARGWAVQALVDDGVLALIDREAVDDVRSWPEVALVGGVHLPTRVIPRIRRKAHEAP